MLRVAAASADGVFKETFAAEAFHRMVTSGASYMNEDAFSGLLNAYLANTPDEHHEWLRGRIEHGNEPPLGKRLRQLAARAGAATRPLIGKRERWAYTLSQVRNELTHIGPKSREFRGEDLLFLTESVYAVVRICMLMECGVSHEILTSKATKEYRSSWIFEPRLTCANAIQRVQHPGFSLVTPHQ